MSLRKNLSDRSAIVLAQGPRSVADRLLANAFFWRHTLPSLIPRLRAGKLAQVFAERRALLGSRISAFELRIFGDDVVHAAAVRDDLFLQLDLQAMQRGADTAGAALNTKGGFAKACRAHDLPHAETFALGADRHLPAGVDLPLFLKPESANRARGCAVIEEAGENAGEDGPDGGFALVERSGTKTGGLSALLAGHCTGEALVAQPVLANHPALAAMVGPVPLTLRIVTGIRDGEARHLSTLAEIPLDDIRPLSKKWAMLPVDGDRGVIGEADPEGRHCPDPHPLTGQRLSGQPIPHWDAAKALALKAHMLIAPQLKMVGWDLAITQGGPVLIEGNVNWAVATHCRNSAGFNLDPARRFAAFVADGQN